MLRRVGKNLAVYRGEPPTASVELEADGFTLLRGVFTHDEVEALRAEVLAVFETCDESWGEAPGDQHRHEMLNRSALSQAAIGHPTILAAIEPLLGNDCHVIANTAWNNPPEFPGAGWHCDAGPHVPRPAEVTYDGRPAVLLEGLAGDVALFVSDSWHRGTPANGGHGRLFLQAHYGRRDMAQRLRPTARVNYLGDEAIARAGTPRAQSLVGLHAPYFYDR